MRSQVSLGNSALAMRSWAALRQSGMRGLAYLPSTSCQRARVSRLADIHETSVDACTVAVRWRGAYPHREDCFSPFPSRRPAMMRAMFAAVTAATVSLVLLAGGPRALAGEKPLLDKKDK